MHAGYGVITNQRGKRRQVGYNHFNSNKRKWNIHIFLSREWNNCFLTRVGYLFYHASGIIVLSTSQLR